MPAKKGNGTALTDIKAEIQKELQAISSQIEAPTADRIRVEGTKFITPDGAQAEELSVVIVAFNTMRTYYDTPWDPNNINPPACFAIGSEPKNLIPSDNSPDKQADACSSCLNSQWGSGPTENSQACRTYRVLIVTPADRADGPLLQYRISATGLKSFDSYVTQLANRYGTLPVGVVTGISLDLVRTYAVPQFEMVAPNEHLQAHFGRREEAAKMLLTEPSLQASEEASVVKAAPRRKKKANKRSAVRR